MNLSVPQYQFQKINEVLGLEYLREEGLSAAMLYVDRTNTPAIKLYESIGFAHWDTDVMFQMTTN